MKTTGRTKAERRASAISKKLASALLALESFESDPEVVLDDAEIFLTGKALKWFKLYLIEY